MLTYCLIFLTLMILIIPYFPTFKRRRRLEKLLAHIPGPFAFPFVGSIHIFFGSVPDILKVMSDMKNAYNGPYKFWLGNEVFFTPDNPEDCNVVLCNDKAMGKADILYAQLRKLAKEGLIFSKESSWRKHRKVLQPLFKYSNLKEYVSIYQKYAEKMLVELDAFNLEDGSNDYVDVFYNNFFKIAFETLTGKDISTEVQAISLNDCLNRLLDITEMRMFKVWLKYDFIFKLTPEAKEHKMLLSKLRGFSNKLLQERKIQLSCSTSDEEKSSCGIIDSLITSLECCDKAIVDEMMTITAAATHTSSPTLQFTMILLGMHPDIQEKVYNEVLNAIGPVDEVNYTNLQHLKYTEIVIKESLRLFPTAPLISRQLREDVKLKSFTLPAGSNVNVNILEIHRNEKYWPDANSFIPERFLPENATKRHSHAYLPFSLGPRSCIGYKYAMMALLVFVANIVRKYKITTSYKSIDEIEVRYYISMGPIHGTKCQLKRRSEEMHAEL